MRTDYYNQLRRHLEPENISIQSKSKSLVPNSDKNSSVLRNGTTKTKQDLFRNQQSLGSLGSFDAPALI